MDDNPQRSERDRRQGWGNCAVCMAHSGHEERIDALKVSIDVAKQEMDRRLEGMNEFQNRMNKLEATFLTKSEAQALRDKLETVLTLRIKHVEQQMEDIVGKAREAVGSAKWANVIISAVISAAVVITGHFIFQGGR